MMKQVGLESVQQKCSSCDWNIPSTLLIAAGVGAGYANADSDVLLGQRRFWWRCEN
jgi:hypothetical protein